MNCQQCECLKCANKQECGECGNCNSEYEHKTGCEDFVELKGENK